MQCLEDELASGTELYSQERVCSQDLWTLSPVGEASFMQLTIDYRHEQGLLVLKVLMEVCYLSGDAHVVSEAVLDWFMAQ